MAFKKYLKRGQASLEYFILFSIIIILTILALNALSPDSFLFKVQNTIQGEKGLFKNAAKRIIQSDYYSTSNSGPGGGGGGGGGDNPVYTQ